MAYVVTPRGNIYYEVSDNKKPPLVLCQGLSRSIDYWLGFDKQLEKNFRVIKIESAGVGRSAEKSNLPWTLSMYDYADDVVAVMDDLNLEQAPIFGLSLGGMTALATGLRHPDRVQSLMVLNTSIAGQRTFRMSPNGITLLAKTPFTNNLSGMWTQLLISKHLPNERKEKIKAGWDDILKKQGTPALDVAARQIIAALKFNVGPQLKNIVTPTLVLYGDQDFFVPGYNSVKIHSLLPNAKLVKIENAGHEAHLCQPQALASEMVSFIKSVS